MIVQARAAAPADIDDLVHMAELMYAVMGITPRQGWRAAARAEVARRLGKDVVGFVVDDGHGRVVSSGIGVVAARMPSPTMPSTRFGYIQWVATEPAWQRRGCARAVLAALVDWFRTHGVVGVELHATADGEPLYRSLGFGNEDHPGLRLSFH